MVVDVVKGGGYAMASNPVKTPSKGLGGSLVFVKHELGESEKTSFAEPTQKKEGRFNVVHGTVRRVGMGETQTRVETLTRFHDGRNITKAVVETTLHGRHVVSQKIIVEADGGTPHDDPFALAKVVEEITKKLFSLFQGDSRMVTQVNERPTVFIWPGFSVLILAPIRHVVKDLWFLVDNDVHALQLLHFKARRDDDGNLKNVPRFWIQLSRF